MSDDDSEFTEKERLALRALARQKIGEWPTRRQAIAGAAAVGAGGFMAGQASADASTSDSDGNVGIPSDRVDVFANGVSADSVNTVQWLDPGASDWGQAVNNAVSSMSSGDILMIPPGTYASSTTATPDKQIAIKGAAGPSVRSAGPAVAVEMQSDTTAIEWANRDTAGSLGGTIGTIENIKFIGSGAGGSADGVVMHGRCQISDCAFREFGGHGLALDQTEANGNTDNLNGSRVVGASVLGNGGDGIWIGTSTGVGSKDRNAMFIEVASGNQSSGSIINNNSGFGNQLYVRHCEDADQAIRINDNECLAHVGHAEGSLTNVVVFASSSSSGYAFVLRSGTPSADVFSDSGNNNVYHYPGHSDGDTYNTQGSRGMRVVADTSATLTLVRADGVDPGLQFENQNGDTSLLYFDGTDLIARDAAGNDTTLT